jgi:hypothetical protein
MSNKPNLRKNMTKQPVPLNKNSGLTYGKSKSVTFKSAKAKLAGSVDTGAIEKRLLKQSPWYASITDPLQGAGAKIPDVVGTPTATSQMVQYVTVPVNANGVAGLKITCPYMLRADAPTAGPTNFYVTNPAATPTVLSWGNGAGGSGSNIFTGNSALTGTATSISVSLYNRVVSAAVYADYEGTDLQDSGDFTCWYSPAKLNTVQAIIGASGNSVAQNLYGSSIIPINRGMPVKVLWFPLSEGDYSYGSFLASDATRVQEFLIADGDTQAWELGIAAQGIAVSTGAIKFTMVVNYEWIPRNNFTSLVAPQPSPIDPMEEQIVIRGMESLDTTGVSTTKRADAQPGTQRTAPTEGREQAGFGGLGMMFDVVKEILPLAGLLL